MKLKTYIAIVVWILVSPVVCRADRVSVYHEFNEMSQPEEIKYSNSNKTAETALLTYTCGNNAKFDREGAYSGPICLKFTSKNDSATTTQVEELAGMQIMHSSGYSSDFLNMFVSKDGETWNKLTGDSIAYRSGGIEVTLPKGNYYIKWKTRKTPDTVPFCIYSVTYYLEQCNCFVYEEE